MPKLVPPWATGPWLRVENGRVRIDVTTFAGLITMGVAVLVVLMAFIIGRVTARPAERIVEKQVPAAAPATIKDTLGHPAHPEVMAGGSTPRPTPAATPTPSPTPAGTPAPSPTPTPTSMPLGKFYVRVAWFGNKQADAEKVKAYLVNKGYDARVQTDPDGTLFVRVGATDRVNAERLCKPIHDLMPQIVKDVPGTLLYKTDDPRFQPYVTNK